MFTVCLRAHFQCLQSATAVVKHIIEVSVPTGFLKYAPDCYFVISGFCSAFLLKVRLGDISSDSLDIFC